MFGCFNYVPGAKFWPCFVGQQALSSVLPVVSPGLDVFPFASPHIIRVSVSYLKSKQETTERDERCPHIFFRLRPVPFHFLAATAAAKSTVETRRRGALALAQGLYAGERGLCLAQCGVCIGAVDCGKAVLP